MIQSVCMNGLFGITQYVHGTTPKLTSSQLLASISGKIKAHTLDDYFSEIMLISNFFKLRHSLVLKGKYLNFQIWTTI